VKQDGKKINNTSQKSPHPDVTSLPVSELSNAEKIEVGPSGDNVPSALNPNTYVRHQRNEKSKLDLTLSDRFQSI
jgi:hypothetical protein